MSDIDCPDLKSENDAMYGEIKALRTENERLRAVIQRAIDRGPYWEWQFEARRALEGK